MLSPHDIFDIQRLIDLYGHIIDEREFSRVGEVFAEDALYDVSDFDSGIVRGAAVIARLWADAGAKHPVGHHATNIVIDEQSDGTVRVVSKGMGVRPNGSVSSVLYRDVVARTSSGWRILERTATLRRPAGNW
jgi:SnoaL-like domain